MKITKILPLMLLISIPNFAQTLGDRVLNSAKNRTYQSVENKGNQAVDGAIENIQDGISNIFKKKDKKPKNNSQSSDEENNSQNNSTTNRNSSSNSPKKNSKFDFEPGKKQIGFDDFSTTNVGDFPLGWNTNSSAEIVTFGDNKQKWLSITKDGYFQPEFVKNLPDNFTLEFDVYTRYRSNNILEYQFYLAPSTNPKKDLSEEYLKNYFKFEWSGCYKNGSFAIVENGEEVSSNKAISIPELNCENNFSTGKFVRFSLWRQNGRLRIYVDQNKVVDLPQAFDMKQKYNVFKLGAKYMNYSNGRENDDEFMISNIRYAVAGEDNRSKLMTEGRFVTNGILFDVNSDVIKPESGSVLKEIASTLEENPSVRVKIIGHTDNDGDDKANLILSQKRAVAIKNALASFYGISLSRFETDGKGESQPLNKNANAAEKAQNRRVEFIKL